MTCHKKSRLLFVLLTSVRQAVTVHSPVCVVRNSHVVSYFSLVVISNQLWFVQWLVASFLTWHSLHGKPVILDGNLALHCYHVTALLVYLIQGNNASLFFFFFYFFQYNLKPRIFKGCTHFLFLLIFVSSIYNGNLFSVSVLKKTLCTPYSIYFISVEKTPTSSDGK